MFTLIPLISGKGRAHHGAIMREATRMIEAGTFKVLLDPGVFSLDTVTDAHNAIAHGTAQGKIVVDIA